MKNNLILLACLLVFVACNEDDEETICPVESETKSNAYFPLKTGNYWVYEYQLHYPDGSIDENIVIDSLIVIGDTLIDEQQYFMLTTDRPGLNTTWFLKDSAGTVLSHEGSMILPPNPRMDFYNERYDKYDNGDTLRYNYDQFPSLDIVSTNFGIEECFLQKGMHIRIDSPNQTIVDTLYYSHFGPVQRSYAYASGPKFVGVLVDYHLE